MKSAVACRGTIASIDFDRHLISNALQPDANRQLYSKSVISELGFGTSMHRGNPSATVEKTANAEESLSECSKEDTSLIESIKRHVKRVRHMDTRRRIIVELIKQRRKNNRKRST